MTDKDLPDKVRKLASRFRQQMEPHTPAAECAVWKCAAEAVEALLPPRPTMADMTPEERHACLWMQADTKLWGRVVIILHNAGVGRAMTLDRRGHVAYEDHDTITPLPDLPRLEWPGDTEPAPALALPGGWKLADHKDCGRVIVTNTTPTRDGRVYYVLPSADPLGFDWLFCDHSELTYIDQGDDTSDAVPESTLAVGTVIESADDPRIDALPVGSILLDRNEEATTKRPRPWGWTGLGNTPNEDEGDEPGPWTVLHIPKEADQ